jgi:hypothetical protein
MVHTPQHDSNPITITLTMHNTGLNACCCSSYFIAGTTTGQLAVDRQACMHACCTAFVAVCNDCGSTNGRMPMTILHHTCTWKKMHLPKNCLFWDADDKAAAHAACVLQPCYTHAHSSSAEATSQDNMSLSRPSCNVTHPQIGS